MTQSNDALLVLMKSIEQEIAIRTEQHVGYQPLPPESTRQEQIEWPAAFLLNRPLNPKLRMEVPNSLGFYKPPHPLLNMPTNSDLDVTIGYNSPSLLSMISRLFRRREKPRPKQEHVSLFEVLADGPYGSCERCYRWKKEEYPDIRADVFYEKKFERAHILFYHGGMVDKRLISEDSR